MYEATYYNFNVNTVYGIFVSNTNVFIIWVDINFEVVSILEAVFFWDGLNFVYFIFWVLFLFLFDPMYSISNHVYNILDLMYTIPYLVKNILNPVINTRVSMWHFTPMRIPAYSEILFILNKTFLTFLRWYHIPRKIHTQISWSFTTATLQAAMLRIIFFWKKNCCKRATSHEL